MKTAVYLHEFPYRIGAGGGTRTLYSYAGQRLK